MNNNLLIILIFVFQSCSNGSKINTNVISSDDMVDILCQRHILLSQINTFQYDGDFSNFHLDSLMSDCYISMGYSNEEFNKSWDYYTTDANDELLVIYDKVLLRLQLLEEETRN
tara:strand:- start:11921 stop:12262 length:342 start_codon:yes stop_codon:yes gene_type:complete